MTTGETREDPVAGLLRVWSTVLRAPVVEELRPGRVWTVTADSGERYILKKVSSFSAPDPQRRYADEARIQTYLLQQGVPVAASVLTDDGRICVTGDDGAVYALSPMLPADPGNGYASGDTGPDAMRLQRIGATLAGMHRALARCPFNIESWQLGPAALDGWWQSMRERLAPDVMSEVEAGIGPLRGSMRRALSAPVQRIHGDIHGENILTEGHRVTGVIDFDHLPLAPRGYDVGHFIAFAVHWHLDEGNHPALPVQQAAPFIARNVLTGYDAVSRLTPKENVDLPAHVLCTALALVDYFVREFDTVHEPWLQTACWIGDNFEVFRLPH